MKRIKKKHMLMIAGVSYLLIFVLAIYANFIIIEAIKNNPLKMVLNQAIFIKIGIAALFITVALDIIVAWALYMLYDSNSLTVYSSFFRIIHAIFLAVATVILLISLSTFSEDLILYGINKFNEIWMFGLFFFGIHLIILSRIVPAPKIILAFTFLAGIAYVVDSFLYLFFSSYAHYSNIILIIVVVPTFVAETSLSAYFIVNSIKIKK